ncbi:VOC family protein [Sphingomicrobium astaxanthinifaciens]|uniref:VOC family protein n=1 Tax=Sphingomicrobium astaxanthinifaciens TaxID=1227949 RepID=UPI001FCC9966|nr:VOC family protein [Sphingomicrobium astaxanthinifaciens]MCJ7422174.1 VOC family protein [Sphingomicrobium astaxanthinifaciens]
MPSARFDYVELPATDLPATKAFYEAAFGWSLTDFGPDYAATVTNDTDIGLAGPGSDAPAAPLPAIRTDDLEAALERVVAAGGRLVRPIFAFPGGRRFEAVDPSGNRVAVYEPDAPEGGGDAVAE